LADSQIMAIFEIASDCIRRIQETTYGAAGLRERGDLQRLLRKQIDVISSDTLVVAEEFCDWEDSRHRIDLLGIDKHANLVVIELKRTEDGGHMELQAVRYAAMVSAMTFDKVVDVYANFLQRIGMIADARSSLLEFLDWDEPDEDLFAQDVRMILVAADFSKELTTSVARQGMPARGHPSLFDEYPERDDAPPVLPPNCNRRPPPRPLAYSATSAVKKILRLSPLKKIFQNGSLKKAARALR
jgi:hypothetical protein